MAARRRLAVACLVAGRLGAEIDGLRRALGADARLRIEPHLTLVPPANVREEDVAAAVELVRTTAARFGPVEARLGPTASFLPVAPVVYLAVLDDSGVLAELQRELATGPFAPPASRPARRFVPHVTLDQHIDPDRAAAALVALADFTAPYVFDAVTVLEYGAERRWVALADAALGRPAVVGRGGVELELAVVERLDPEAAAFVEREWERYSLRTYGDRVRPVRPFAVVARAAGVVVAVAEGEYRGPTTRLARLVVVASRRSEGIGAQLLRAVERLAREDGAVRVRLETLLGGPAEAFYADHGYVRTAVLARWREERDFALLERELPGG